MPSFPSHLYGDIVRLCEESDQLIGQEKHEEAFTRYQAAWELLPDPREEWEAAEWVMAAIGDARFFQGDFPKSKAAFMTVLSCGGSPDNPFIRLRLGQCLFELGDMKESANWLAGAFLSEGVNLFAEDDPKYLEFIKSKLEPPPGGWPEGW